jgi:hypothetical protein
MASADTLLTLEADEEAVVTYLAEYGGLLLRDEALPAAYWLVLRPQAAPTETYYAHVIWDAYPDRPPSVRFHDGIDGRYDVAHAWPVVPGYRVQGVWDICQPFTAEGFAAHPEWATSVHKWVSTGNPFWFVAQNLQNGLNHHYHGRHP